MYVRQGLEVVHIGRNDAQPVQAEHIQNDVANRATPTARRSPRGMARLERVLCERRHDAAAMALFREALESHGHTRLTSYGSYSKLRKATG